MPPSRSALPLKLPTGLYIGSILRGSRARRRGMDHGGWDVDDALERLKQGHRETWEAGDYGTFAERVVDMADRLVERVGVSSGMEVLDVATGTGNAAIRAAARGASVIGLDLTPKLLDTARQRAAAAGVD